MNGFSIQLGFSTASKRRWQPIANANGNGGERRYATPMHASFNRCDSLATISGEPMN